MAITILSPIRRGMNDKTLTLRKPRHARRKDKAAKASRGIDTMLANRSPSSSYEPSHPHQNEVNALVRSLLADSDEYGDVSELISQARKVAKAWGWVN